MQTCSAHLSRHTPARPQGPSIHNRPRGAAPPRPGISSWARPGPALLGRASRRLPGQASFSGAVPAPSPSLTEAHEQPASHQDVHGDPEDPRPEGGCRAGAGSAVQGAGWGPRHRPGGASEPAPGGGGVCSSLHPPGSGPAPWGARPRRSPSCWHCCTAQGTNISRRRPRPLPAPPSPGPQRDAPVPAGHLLRVWALAGKH